MIRTESDLEAELAALLARDPRLAAVAAMAAPLPLRRSEPGLSGLVATIVAQQVSRASADAILRRLAAALDLTRAEAMLSADDELLRQVGLSRPKQRTIRAIAAAVVEGRLDFARIAKGTPEAAIAELTAVHGIGVWTAECHLLFALGHVDVFPAGDLALQVAAAQVLGRPERLSERALRAEAAGWAPHRSTAARLLWAAYHVFTRRDGAPPATDGG